MLGVFTKSGNIIGWIKNVELGCEKSAKYFQLVSFNSMVHFKTVIDIQQHNPDLSHTAKD